MKLKTLWLILDSIFLIVFNILFFTLLGKTIDMADMISYAFITLAYIFLVLSFFIVKKGKDINSVLNLSIYFISVVYFLIELLIGLCFLIRSNSALIAMIFKYVVNVAKGQSVVVGFFVGFIEKAEVIEELQEVATKFPSPILAFTTQFLLFATYLVLLIPNIIANDITIKNVREKNKGISFIKEESNKVFSMLENVTDKNIAKELEKLYDELRFSPTKSVAELVDVENEIKEKINYLENLIKNDDAENISCTIKKLIATIKNRNNKMKSI